MGWHSLSGRAEVDLPSKLRTWLCKHTYLVFDAATWELTQDMAPNTTFHFFVAEVLSNRTSALIYLRRT